MGIFGGYLDFIIYKFDFFIILGGDGMILAVIIYICDSKVFILGINLGWFGFLASIEKKCIYDVIKLFKCGMYSI